MHGQRRACVWAGPDVLTAGALRRSAPRRWCNRLRRPPWTGSLMFWALRPSAARARWSSACSAAALGMPWWLAWPQQACTSLAVLEAGAARFWGKGRRCRGAARGDRQAGGARKLPAAEHGPCAGGAAVEGGTELQPGTGLGPSPRAAKLLAKLRAFMREHVQPAEAVMEVGAPTAAGPSGCSRGSACLTKRLWLRHQLARIEMLRCAWASTCSQLVNQ